ncbi:hypothetical protein [Streptomyces sp. NPDC057257]|uniref:hypothetical protein n=1 Tax=Streptomyces sp. NPDC057257 TaxID=3346071 RepID=UPI00364122BC
MSDAAQPTAAEVRAAAEAVKTALDRHLAAVERRSGEDDPAVYEAFNQLAAAAEAYDELLFHTHQEVTPFDIPATVPPYTGPEPEAIGVLIRQDYTVVEPQRLLAQAERIQVAEGGDGVAVRADEDLDTAQALELVFGEFEADEIASRHKEFGLAEGDSTLWVTRLEEVPEPGEWLDAPFEQPEQDQVICRFEASTSFADGGVDDEFEDDLEVVELDEDEELEPLDVDR